MIKNVVIAILATLCVGFFFYGLTQNVEAKKQAEMTLVQMEIARMCAEQAQQKDKLLASRNEQIQMALNEAREVRERALDEARKAQSLYDKTIRQASKSQKTKE